MIKNPRPLGYEQVGGKRILFKGQTIGVGAR
jgi:hypothetical protein